jgi:hypothetical protein
MQTPWELVTGDRSERAPSSRPVVGVALALQRPGPFGLATCWSRLAARVKRRAFSAAQHRLFGPRLVGLAFEGLGGALPRAWAFRGWTVITVIRHMRLRLAPSRPIRARVHPHVQRDLDGLELRGCHDILDRRASAADVRREIVDLGHDDPRTIIGPPDVR